MYLNQAELRHCIGIAREVAHQYQLDNIAADDPRRSVARLHELCAGRAGRPLNVLELDVHKDDIAVWGACVIYDDHADILVVNGLNHCWRRFVLAKELFHALIDMHEYRNMDIVEHVAEVTAAFPDHGSKPGPSVKAEFLAEIAAMEFLFPYASRRQEIEAAPAGNPNFDEIAEKYKVPRLYVERYMSGNFMKALADYA